VNRLIGPYLFKSDAGGIVIWRHGESCPERPLGVAFAANRREGGAEVREVFRVVWCELNRDREFRDSIGKASLLAVNRPEIVVQRRVEIVGLRMNAQGPGEIRCAFVKMARVLLV